MESVNWLHDTAMQDQILKSIGEHLKPLAPPERTIVIGHKNPDTDSAVSACALAWLLEQQGRTGVQAAAPGILQARTRFIFERCNHPEPDMITDVRPRLSDVMQPAPEQVCEESPLISALEIMRRDHIDQVPICDHQGRYRGMLSMLTMAGRLLGNPDGEDDLLSRQLHSNARLMSEVLNAECLTNLRPDEEEHWSVYVGAMSSDRLGAHLQGTKADNVVLVVGNRPLMYDRAIERGYGIIVLTGDTDVSDEAIEAARQSGTCLLRCSLDSATVLRRLSFSAPINSVPWDPVPSLSPNQLVNEAAIQCRQTRSDAFPVVDQDQQLCGIVDHADFAKTPPYSLVLVDHNEMAQAVDGARQVPIEQIVDHHRLDLPITSTPINVRNEVVGSTSTIIGSMCRESGVTPTPSIAGLLLAGIVTDTMLLRSPTATPRDAEMIEWFAELSGIDPKQFEQEILQAGSVLTGSKPYEVINADCKTYDSPIGKLRVAQVEEAGFESLTPRQSALQDALKTSVHEDQLSAAVLLVTNVVESTSVMLVAGQTNFINSLPWPEKNGVFHLKSIVSRKKQLLPALLSVAEKLS